MGIIINRNGEIGMSNQGLKMKIIKYNTCEDIDIEFENNYVAKNRQYSDFLKGTIRNPYYPTVYDTGYFGEGEYSSKVNNKQTIHYTTWKNVFIRCFDKNELQKHPAYKDCTVCKEWCNFQNFAQWFDNNYYIIENEQMHLDKDILIKGNKIYSPEFCIFVPQRINKLFIKSDSKRGKYPNGIFLQKDCNKIRAELKKDGRKKYLGLYNNIEEAFEKYKTEKEKYIKEIADEYKDKIPQKLYDAMYKYEVEITD